MKANKADVFSAYEQYERHGGPEGFMTWSEFLHYEAWLEGQYEEFHAIEFTDPDQGVTYGF